MKKHFLLLLTILMANTVFAQTDNYTVAFSNFQAHYNQERFEDVFNNFSDEMKKALPLANTKQFLSGLKSQVGKIERGEFIQYEQKTFATYKTKFEKATLAVNISLDNQNKISGFVIKPYEQTSKIENNSVNSLNKYPIEIAESIFSKAKNFPNNTQLSIAIIKNGTTSYYGIVKENDVLKPIENQNKIFEIGSITKVFTSTILASLLLENKIKLKDIINSYYPFPFKDNIKISFASLANHTAGLPKLPENLDLSNEANPYKNYGKNELDEYLKNLLLLENEPLKKYSYSNLGAGLLSYTLGLSQKTSFQELVNKRIFLKYEMMNSFTSSQNLEPNLIKGLNTNGDIISNWDFDVLFGAGGILSTTADLAKFATAQFDPTNKELELTRKPTFVINDKIKIGLGWHILKSENNKEVFWHNGGTGGYSSSMSIDVENKTAVILLSNVSAFNPKMENIDQLGFELLKQVTKK
jgi:CubicO group peptidase (beta-lactamase class C family)